MNCAELKTVCLTVVLIVYNYKDGKSWGIHIEPGPDGGLVVLDDTTIFERALQILAETEDVSEAQQA